jgi:copper chaperone CopZ
MTTVSFKVGGMKCGGCEKTVQDIANALDGVLSSKASSADGSMTVDFDEGKVSEVAIKSAISAKGYPAT